MKHKIFFTTLVIVTAIVSFTTFTSWKNNIPKASTAAIKTSVTKSFAVLQTSGAKFISAAKCASCHHATLTSVIAEKLKAKGLSDIDTTAAMRTDAINNTLFFIDNPNLVYQFVSAKFLPAYMLLGLEAEKFPANYNTDLAVDYLISQALPDGHFKAEYARVPFEIGDVHLTATAIRAIQLSASPAKNTQVKKLVANTKHWLEKLQLTNEQELAFQLLGMKWCASSETSKIKIAKKLIAMQNNDGGWSQLPTMRSDSYATGEVLYALSESGVMNTANDVYAKGVNYLLQTQDETGAWIVETRSNPIQPFISSGFPPLDESQYISAAATNWATLALVNALPDKK